MRRTTAANRLREVLARARTATAPVARRHVAGRLDATVVATHGHDVTAIELDAAAGQPLTYLSVPTSRVHLWLTGDLAPDATGAWDAKVVLSTPLHREVLDRIADLAGRTDFVEVLDLTDPAEVRYDLTPAGRAAVEGASRG